MNLLTCVLTNNDCYKTKQTIKPKGVMVHSTGANNPNLRRYVQPNNSTQNKNELLKLLGTNSNKNDWNRPGTNACVHGFIGKLADGNIATVQTLSWNHRGWHAGTGTTGRSANNTHISFEICEDGLTDRNYFNKVYKEAVELTAYLCKEYNLNPLEDGVVICHSEGYRRGIASGHADVEHWFPKHGKTMDMFRKDVYNEMNKKEDADMTYYKNLNDVPISYAPSINKLVNKGVLKGTGNGELNISDDFCRVMTVFDRLGYFD